MSFVHKQTLLNRLLDATRECQTQYSTKKEIMTGANSCVSCVCRQFEDVFNHGLKQKPVVSGIATIQNVTGLQLVDQQETVFWHCIQKHLTRHEIERYNNLKYISTDIGKGRAWLRSALNEHSLERIFQMILSDLSCLAEFYTPDAFLLDEEKASLLPQIAAGLKSIVFNINTDDPALSNISQSSSSTTNHKRVDSGSGFSFPTFSQVGAILGHEVSMEEFPEATMPLSQSPRASEIKKRKKKSKTKIISFGANGGYVSDRTESFSSMEGQESFGMRRQSYHASDSSVDSLPLSKQPQISLDSSKQISNDLGIRASSPSGNTTKTGAVTRTRDTSRDDIDIYKTTVHSEDNQKSDDYTEKNCALNAEEVCVGSNGVKKIAEKLESSLLLEFESSSDISLPNESTDVNSKTVVPTLGSQRTLIMQNSISDSTSGVISTDIVFTPRTYDPDSFSSRNSVSSIPNILLDGNASLLASHSLSPRSVSPNSMSDDCTETNSKVGDLQKALVALLQRKDELVSENKAIKELLDAENQHSAMLREENGKLKERVEEQKNAKKEDALKQERENDVLRNQLKKYVGAVHALQQNKNLSISQDIGGVSVASETGLASAPDKEEDGELKLYEKKLVDVAEMHGELLEFTESLHTRFLSALSLLHKMHDELVALRGPMPTDDVIKAIEADKPLSERSAVTMPFETRALVNVWVPSVFSQGSGPESYHVYQVYICVGEDEWNVYRRYSDFHSLHSTLCKSYPQIQNFGFPPKKGIGNRSSKFVEERRKSFQKYIRLVMNNIFQNNAQLKACPTKATLLHILPFFSDAGDQCRVIVSKQKHK